MKELFHGQIANEETRVRQAVEAFYTAFDAGFVGACDFSTEDWNHINPNGGWARGRESVLKEVRKVHTTFLKDVTDTIEGMTVRFASGEAAVATVTSVMSPFSTPDGVSHENERHIRTFVLVKRGGRWLVMQDQNTVVGGKLTLSSHRGTSPRSIQIMPAVSRRQADNASVTTARPIQKFWMGLDLSTPSV